MRRSRGPARERQDITWFVDRSLGRGVADALRAVGETAVHHDDEFPQDALDAEWLPVCGDRGWIVLTKDKAIRRRIQEREAHLLAGGRAFFLTSGNMRGEEMAQLFVSHIDKMRRLAGKQTPPFIALVDKSGVHLHSVPSGKSGRQGR